MSGSMCPAPRWSRAALALALLLAALPTSAKSPDALHAPPRLERPSIVTQPADQSVLVGQRATFRVAAKGTPPLLYQWKRNGKSIRGAHAASYTTPRAVLADDGAVFTVEVVSLLGRLASAPARLHVRPPPTPPAVASQPADVEVVEGQPATFQVTATGTAPLAYQWLRDGVAIPGATAASWTTPATALSDSGATFTVRVTNAVGSISSTPATLTVKPAPRPPVLTAPPHDQVVTEGDAATFTVGASGDEPLSYQWSRDGVALAGAVASAYTTPILTRADDGATFTVTVTNAAGSVTSAPATLRVTPRIETLVLYQAGVLGDGWAPQIWAGCSTPDPQATFAGSTVLAYDLTCDTGWDAGVLGHWSSTFDLSPYDTLSFDIGSDGVAGMDTLVVWFDGAAKTIPVGPVTQGQLTHVLVSLGDLALPSPAINQLGWFNASPNPGPRFYLDNVLLTGSAGPQPPSIVTPPADQSVVEGQRATFSVVAAGTGPLGYQWSKDGTPIPGASSRSYTTAAAAAGDTGARYTVTVSNAVGTVTSAAAVLTVQPDVTPPASIPCQSDCAQVAFTIDVAQGPTERVAGPLPVSPYVYGINPASGDLDRTTRFGVLRAGGNAFSAWNWTNNYRNSGADYCFWQGLATGSGPAGELSWIPRASEKGIASLVTVPIGDYVSARVDNQAWPACNSVPGSTNVNDIPFAPSSYFVANRPQKGGAPCAYPGPGGESGDCAIDPTASVVYQDEFVNYVKRWWVDGKGATVFLALDNEPNYWMGTHPEIWSNPKATYDEIVDRDRTYAAAARAVWPEAKVFGPVVAQDGIVYAHDYTRPDEFLDYYLPRMSGLLDVLDVHYYNQSTDPATCLQNPRAFWDPAYTVPNNQDGMDYIAGNLPDYAHRRMIPRLLDKIAAAGMTPVPGLAFTEYDSGCEGDISGGVAQAEVLGLFGRYGVYAGMAWFVGRDVGSDYAGVAFDAYRNYDGAGATVGDLAVAAATTDDVDTSVYAFTHAGDPGRMELVALNKTTARIPVHVTIATRAMLTTAQVYRLVRSATVAVTPAPGTAPAVSCDGARCAFDAVLEPLSVATIALR